jgi:NAD(P)H-hydrate epimerase
VGTSSDTQQVVRDIVTAAEVPVVLDADGLNAFAGDAAGLRAVKPPCVLTPHPGESGRLLGRTTAEVQGDRLGAVRELAERSGAIVVLKGYRSLVCDPNGRVAINPTGNPGMATGGSGDVLTGLIAALIAQGLEPYAAARVGVFLHGEAGDVAATVVGEISLIASDIIAALPDAFAGCVRDEPTP